MTTSIYLYAVETFKAGESIYLRTLIKTFSKSDFIERIFVLIDESSDKNIIESEYLQTKVVYMNYGPFIRRFDRLLSNKLNKCLLLIGQITGLIRFVKKAQVKRMKFSENTLIISPYVTEELLLFPGKLIVNPQDFRKHYKKERSFNPLKVLKKLLREVLYIAVLKNSFIVVDSQHNKDDLQKYYGSYAENFAIIRSLPDFDEIDKIKKQDNRHIYIQLKDKYGLFEKYLFYPAHLIPDNNHLNLLEAIYLVEKKYKKKVNIILCGGRNDLEDAILKKTECYKLNVKYLNYIPYKEVVYIMLNAKGLVFPTFIGPSLCIWEGFYLGVPVCCSNISAFQEQVGDAGLLFDPNNVEDMAEKIYRIWIDETLRQELIKKGYERVKDMTLENYAKQWERVIEEALEKVRL